MDARFAVTNAGKVTSHHDYLREAYFAARHQMRYLKRMQAPGEPLAYEQKDDKSIVTEPDKVSDRIGKERILRAFPAHRFWGEESGFTGTPDSLYTHVEDGLDGTTVYKQGLPTFTVAHGRVRNADGKLVAALAMNTLGTAVSYDEDVGTRLLLAYDRGSDQFTWHPLTVQPVADLKKESVFVDISRGFTRTHITDGKPHTVMIDGRKEYFMRQLQRNVKGIHIPGSNILQQMTTVLRPNGAAGYFMTAAGGPQDAIGVGFIVGAGGAARAFNVDGRTLTEVDPFVLFGPDGNGYDLLVGARDAKTAGKLVDILADAYKNF